MAPGVEGEVGQTGEAGVQVQVENVLEDIVVPHLHNTLYIMIDISMVTLDGVANSSLEGFLADTWAGLQTVVIIQHINYFPK